MPINPETGQWEDTPMTTSNPRTSGVNPVNPRVSGAANWNPTTQQWENLPVNTPVNPRDSATVTTPHQPVDDPDYREAASFEVNPVGDSDDPFYVVDAHTGDVYHGVIHQDLTDAYNAPGRRALATPRAIHIGAVAPVLARCVTRHDDVTNTDVSTWYLVDVTTLPPGPIPGEYKLVHLEQGV